MKTTPSLVRVARCLAALSVGGAALAILSVSSAAWAQAWPTEDPSFVPNQEAGGPAEKFGEKGQISLFGDFALGFGYQSDTLPSSAGGRTLTRSGFTIAPNIDIFFWKNLALGGLIHLRLDSGKNLNDQDVSSASLLFAPTLGYNILVSRRVTFFPKLGVGYGMVSYTGAGDLKSWRLPVLVMLPLLFHPVQNFFVGFGPQVSRDLISKIENPATKKDVDNTITTRFDLSLYLGGFF